MLQQESVAELLVRDYSLSNPGFSSRQLWFFLSWNLICVCANHWPRFVQRSASILQKKMKHFKCGQNCNSILWSTVYLSVPAVTLQSCITNCPCARLRYCFLRSSGFFFVYILGVVVFIWVGGDFWKQKNVDIFQIARLIQMIFCF